jgi:hypothetical protein
MYYNYYSDSTSNTASASTIAWGSWTNSTCSTTSSTTTIVWNVWAGQQGSQGYAGTGYVIPPETEEQRLARERTNARLAEEAKVRKEKEAAKAKKARQLLKDVLTKEQDKQLEEKGFFELVSVKSGQRYRINKGRSGNVQKLDANGAVLKRLCFHPVEHVHDYDTMAIQAVMLQVDEEAVQRVANFS